jgi:hypothetical protein
MNALAKTPSPLRPAVLISYIGVDSTVSSAEVSCEKFPFRTGGSGKRSVPVEIRFQFKIYM